MSHKDFTEELSAVCGETRKNPHKQAYADHVPLPVAQANQGISKVALPGLTFDLCTFTAPPNASFRSQNNRDVHLIVRIKRADESVCAWYIPKT